MSKQSITSGESKQSITSQTSSDLTNKTKKSKETEKLRSEIKAKLKYNLTDKVVQPKTEIIFRPDIERFIKAAATKKIKPSKDDLTKSPTAKLKQTVIGKTDEVTREQNEDGKLKRSLKTKTQSLSKNIDKPIPEVTDKFKIQTKQLAAEQVRDERNKSKQSIKPIKIGKSKDDLNKSKQSIHIDKLKSETKLSTEYVHNERSKSKQSIKESVKISSSKDEFNKTKRSIQEKIDNLEIETKLPTEPVQCEKGKSKQSIKDLTKIGQFKDDLNKSRQSFEEKLDKLENELKFPNESTQDKSNQSIKDLTKIDQFKDDLDKSKQSIKSTSKLSPSVKISVKTKDDKEMQMDLNFARMLGFIANQIKDINIEDAYKFPPISLDITSRSLELMIKFADLHQEDLSMVDFTSKERRKSCEIRANDKIFVENLAQNDLFDLVVASNLVDFQLLLDVLCKAIANMIREKSVDEIRKMFNLKSDFEPEDQEELDRESAWIEKYN